MIVPGNRGLFGLALLLLSFCAAAETITLQSITDFQDIEAGQVPYYRDTGNERNVLAINAAVEHYRNKFARANHTFLGAAGTYTITINALGEIDGDCEYRLLVDDVMIGSATNPAVAEDYTVVKHNFEGVVVNTGSVISIESNAVSNNAIPEGDAFAFARGRWRSIELYHATTDQPIANSTVDLSIATNTTNGNLEVGNTIEVEVVVTNASTEVIATNPIVKLTMSENLFFNNSMSCSFAANELRCELAELGLNSEAIVKVDMAANAPGQATLTAEIIADQVDLNPTDNIIDLSFNITDTAPETTPVSPLPDPDNTPIDENQQTDTSQSDVINATKGGSASLWFLLSSLLSYIVGARSRKIGE